MADFTPEQMAAIAKMVAAGIAEGLKQRAEAYVDAKRKATPDEQVKSDAKVAKAFAKAGYKDIVLFNREQTLAAQGSTVTILTFNKWMELGRRPKEGEHALKFGRFRFFHKSQTRIATVEERKENFQKMKDAIAKNEAEKAAKAGIAA